MFFSFSSNTKPDSSIFLKQAEFDWSSKLQGKIDGLQRIEIFFKGKYCETLHMAVQLGESNDYQLLIAAKQTWEGGLRIFVAYK